MAEPAGYNILIYQGDTYARPFQIVQFIEGEETPVDFTELTPLAQVRLRPEDTEIIAQFTVNVTEPEEGKFTLSMTDEQTRLLPRISFYDFQTRDASDNSVKTWFAGKINSPREVSRDYNGA